MSILQYRVALVLIVLAALGLRLAATERFVGLSALPDPADGLDQLDYELLAWQLATGHGYTLQDGLPTARRTPGTSLLLLPVYVVFGRNLLAARVWFALLSAATCVVVAWLLERNCGRVAALIGGALLAINPGSFYYTLHLWSEPGYGLFVTLATLLAVTAWRLEARWWPTAVLAGICWGGAFLLRPQVVFLLPFAVLALLWLPAKQRPRAMQQMFVQCLLVGAIALPWVLRNAVVMGQPCVATVVGPMTFWGAHNEVTLTDPEWRGRWDIPDHLIDAELMQASEAAKGDIAMVRAWKSLRRHADQIPQLLAAKLYWLVTPFEPTPNRAVYWSFALSWLLTAPLVAVGLRELLRRDPALATLLLCHFGGVVLGTLLFYGGSRFRHAIEPLLMVSAAVGLATLLVWISRVLSTATVRVQTLRRALVPSAGR